MKILSFESSCDETSCAVIEDGRHILSDVISTQVPIHKKFGGVVPEIASRHHIEDVLPVAIEALEQAGCSWEDMDAIAVTQGPGLVGALLVGVAAAKGPARPWISPWWRSIIWKAISSPICCSIRIWSRLSCLWWFPAAIL